MLKEKKKIINLLLMKEQTHKKTNKHQIHKSEQIQNIFDVIYRGVLVQVSWDIDEIKIWRQVYRKWKSQTCCWRKNYNSFYCSLNPSFPHPQ